MNDSVAMMSGGDLRCTFSILNDAADVTAISEKKFSSIFKRSIVAKLSLFKRVAWLRRYKMVQLGLKLLEMVMESTHSRYRVFVVISSLPGFYLILS